MAARSIWNGTLEVKKLAIDIKLYAAVEDETVHFHLLHDKDHVRVKQHMVSPSTGKARDQEEIVKGYEIKPGTFVIIDEEDLAKLEPVSYTHLTLPTKRIV